MDNIQQMIQQQVVQMQAALMSAMNGTVQNAIGQAMAAQQALQRPPPDYDLPSRSPTRAPSRSLSRGASAVPGQRAGLRMRVDKKALSDQSVQLEIKDQKRPHGEGDIMDEDDGKNFSDALEGEGDDYADYGNDEPLADGKYFS